MINLTIVSTKSINFVSSHKYFLTPPSHSPLDVEVAASVSSHVSHFLLSSPRALPETRNETSRASQLPHVLGPLSTSMGLWLLTNPQTRVYPHLTQNSGIIRAGVSGASDQRQLRRKSFPPRHHHTPKCHLDIILWLVYVRLSAPTHFRWPCDWQLDSERIRQPPSETRKKNGQNTWR